MFSYSNPKVYIFSVLLGEICDELLAELDVPCVLLVKNVQVQHLRRHGIGVAVPKGLMRCRACFSTAIFITDGSLRQAVNTLFMDGLEQAPDRLFKILPSRTLSASTLLLEFISSTKPIQAAT